MKKGKIIIALIIICVITFVLISFDFPYTSGGVARCENSQTSDSLDNASVVKLIQENNKFYVDGVIYNLKLMCTKEQYDYMKKTQTFSIEYKVSCFNNKVGKVVQVTDKDLINMMLH